MKIISSEKLLAPDKDSGSDSDILSDDASKSGEGQDVHVDEDEKDLSTLSEDSDEGEKEEKEVEEKEEEKEDLDKELEDFEKDKEKIDEDLVKDIRRPALRKIMAKYPNIDKEFPDIKHVFHREQKFSEICGTVEDAKEMSEKAEVLDTFNARLSPENADVRFFLGALNDPAREKFSRNFLPTLYKADRDLFGKVTRPLLVSIMHKAYQAAGNDDANKDTVNQRNSVLNLCGYLFGKKELPKFDDDEIVDPKISAQQEELNKEKGNLYAQRYNSYHAGVQEFVENKLISEVVGRLDPNLSDYQKAAIANAVIDDIDAELMNDNLHKTTMNSLWRRAEKENLDPKWRSQIITAYLGRARQNLPNLIKRYVKSGSKSAVSTNEKKDLTTTGKERTIDKKINPKSTRQISDLDLINAK